MIEQGPGPRGHDHYHPEQEEDKNHAKDGPQPRHLLLHDDFPKLYDPGPSGDPHDQNAQRQEHQDGCHHAQQPITSEYGKKLGQLLPRHETGAQKTARKGHGNLAAGYIVTGSSRFTVMIVLAHALMLSYLAPAASSNGNFRARCQLTIFPDAKWKLVGSKEGAVRVGWPSQAVKPAALYVFVSKGRCCMRFWRGSNRMYNIEDINKEML